MKGTFMVGSGSQAQARARLIYDPIEAAYDFGAEHPLQARRLVALMDLLETSGLWHSDNEQTRLPLRAATMEELSLIHTPDYIEVVQRLSLSEDGGVEAQRERKRL